MTEPTRDPNKDVKGAGLESGVPEVPDVANSPNANEPGANEPGANEPGANKPGDGIEGAADPIFESKGAEPHAEQPAAQP
ncbi:MAG: hypothetical protein ACI89X_001908, partial [Planctomycetota bacterium]